MPAFSRWVVVFDQVHGPLVQVRRAAERPLCEEAGHRENARARPSSPPSSSASSSSSSTVVSHCRSHLPGGLGAGRRPPKSYDCPLQSLLCGAKKRHQYISKRFESVLTSNNKYFGIGSKREHRPRN